MSEEVKAPEVKTPELIVLPFESYKKVVDLLQAMPYGQIAPILNELSQVAQGADIPVESKDENPKVEKPTATTKGTKLKKVK
jgi:hypothetical protein